MPSVRLCSGDQRSIVTLFYPHDEDFLREEADLALLRCSDATSALPYLPLSDRPATAGDEVIVLGYPTGLSAMLARLDRTQLDPAGEGGTLDFWRAGELLARQFEIKPLANRGIVGQTSATRIVYDAPTTSGGSGGPVLDRQGRVVAVNTAVLAKFSGSNLGVPARYARVLIAQTARSVSQRSERESG